MQTEVTVERRPVVPAASNDTMILTAILAKLEPDELVENSRLSAAIGRDVRGGAAGVLRTAIRRAMRDHGVVVETVRNTGLRRVVGNELIAAQRCGIDRIRREARRRNEKLSKVDLTKLDNAQKVSACSLASMFGAFAHMSTSSGVKRIEAAATKADAAQLSIGTTLALFHE